MLGLVVTAEVTEVTGATPEVATHAQVACEAAVTLLLEDVDGALGMRNIIGSSADLSDSWGDLPQPIKKSLAIIVVHLLRLRRIVQTFYMLTAKH